MRGIAAEAVRDGLLEGALDRLDGDVEPGAFRNQVPKILCLLVISASAQDLMNQLVQAIDGEVVHFKKLANSVIGDASRNAWLVVAYGDGYHRYAERERFNRRVESGVCNAERGRPPPGWSGR